jgi:hypothetical protein
MTMRRLTQPKTARERAARRGWVFRPINPMLELILRVQHAHRGERLRMRTALRAARLHVRQQHGRTMPGEPTPDGRRIMAYYQQNGTPRRALTPRQQRRRIHKDPSLRIL